ncbi:hypothetical protein [Micromonospora maritima]|uniref:hypothetical protein n=1 Tax=Micromonospora maritima TaxID=986711 RepID=UPI00157CAA76|nr:hypothetical protein [Micromonospora maritima]
MKLILTETRYGTIHVSTEQGAIFFKIEPGAIPSYHATIRSYLPGLADSHARTVEEAAEKCVTSLSNWMRHHLEGRVPIELVDERGKRRTT